jgi:LmbE family N-acetylglucosaminyl deacetylase
MDRSLGTLLAVLAHPDDETFGMGGTLALYARKGYTVHLVCATRGEVGTVDPEFLRGGRSIAELREGELRCAAEHLGLSGVYFLGFRDSGMPGSPDNKHPDAQVAHPVDEVAGRIVKYIRELKPDVVITFDPMGGYLHPDHIHVHQATVLAFEKAGDAAFHPEAGAPYRPRALYFQVFPRQLFKIATRLMPVFGMNPRKFGRNQDVDLLALTEYNFPTDARIDIRPVEEIKAAATHCHASQMDGMQTSRGGILSLIMRGMSGRESYMRAYPPTNGNRHVATDLFEGI